MSVNKWLMPLGFGLLSLFLSQGVSCAEATAQINQDSSCMKCHKRNGAMHGHHAQDSLKLSCSSCHGERGNHPRKPNNMMVFSSESNLSLESKNAVCLKCHIPTKLAKKEWTHNVHAQKTSCTSCHKLHPKLDPMTGLSDQDRSQERSNVCRNCHTVQR